MVSVNTKHHSIRKLVFSALLAALTCVCTMVIQIPVPATGGYVNLGDSVVLLCAWYIGGVYGAAAAGIGAMLADLFSGYAIYAPATFIIKALMAWTASLLFRRIHGQKGQILGVCTAMLLLLAGYFVYEAFVLGFGMAAVAAIPANLLQGAIGCTFGAIMSQVMEKNAFLRNLRKENQ